VDTPSKKELFAANNSIEQIRECIGADSLAYLSLGGMKKACGDGEKTTCCTLAEQRLRGVTPGRAVEQGDTHRDA
jgi:glutamine phosphoribosylpyrophosphate amidotransferase